MNTTYFRKKKNVMMLEQTVTLGCNESSRLSEVRIPTRRRKSRGRVRRRPQRIGRNESRLMCIATLLRLRLLLLLALALTLLLALALALV